MTKSSDFLTEILSGMGEVVHAYESPVKNHATVIEGVSLKDAADYDLVVINQMEAVALAAAKMNLPNVVFCPMYDSCRNVPDDFWPQLNRIKIVCFCSFLHTRIQRAGHKSCAYFQYFTDPDLSGRVTGFDAIRPFFWQRRSSPSWKEVGGLLGDAKPESMTLHTAMDPDEEEAVVPDEETCRKKNIEVTEWFPRKEELLERIAASNLYFAPRLAEGIGMSFLEALAMGIPLVAIDAPTMNEYIVDGWNGYLYEPDNIVALPLEPERLGVLGSNAFAGAQKGFEQWHLHRPRLIRFLSTATNELSRKDVSFGTSFDALTGNGQAAADAMKGGKRDIAPGSSSTPKVTVVTVVRNAKEEFLETMASVVSQDFSNFETVVVDGGSTDGTLDEIRKLDELIDCWVSENDDGPYDAMNKAVDLAHGEFVIFMNAGDQFCNKGSLRLLVEGAPDNADFIYGHHIYLTADGIEEVHRAGDFTAISKGLKDGELPQNWLGKVPGHQVTLTRTKLLQEHRFDTDFKIAADHELLCRMAKQGGKFHNANVIAAVYVAGGLSSRNLLRCILEWKTIYAEEGCPWVVSEHFYGMLRHEFGKEALSGLPEADAAELNRYLRLKTDLARAEVKYEKAKALCARQFKRYGDGMAFTRTKTLKLLWKRRKYEKRIASCKEGIGPDETKYEDLIDRELAERAGVVR
ncbi:MAG: glycosyltransferase [Luteolibacter sp.]